MLAHGLQYVMFRSGAVTTTGVEACAFIDPDGGERPTLQLYCVPTIYLDRDVSGVERRTASRTRLLRPKARGSVRPASADPLALPQVDAQFFGHPDDLRRPSPGCATPARSSRRPCSRISSTGNSFREPTRSRTRISRPIAGER